MPKYQRAHDMDSWLCDSRIANGEQSPAWQSAVNAGNGEDALVDLVDQYLSSNCDVLDLGCGHGESTLSLAARCHTITGIEHITENFMMTTISKKMSPTAFVLNLLMSALFFPAITLLLAGNWRWVEGWLFGLWFDVMILFNIIYLYWKDPALLAERTKAPGSDNQKGWDKYLILVLFAIASLWLIILPLDAERFHWSPAFPLWLKILGGVALVPALYFIERATIDNTYLSAMVRIQSEREQQVITTGVYGFVRHPLYLGCALMMFGAPLLVGSVYGLLLSLIGLLVLAGRIIGEEKMMSEELAGYEAYKEKVPYRLIPFVW